MGQPLSSLFVYILTGIHDKKKLLHFPIGSLSAIDSDQPFLKLRQLF